MRRCPSSGTLARDLLVLPSRLRHAAAYQPLSMSIGRRGCRGARRADARAEECDTAPRWHIRIGNRYRADRTKHRGQGYIGQRCRRVVCDWNRLPARRPAGADVNDARSTNHQQRQCEGDTGHQSTPSHAISPARTHLHPSSQDVSAVDSRPRESLSIEDTLQGGRRLGCQPRNTATVKRNNAPGF